MRIAQVTYSAYESSAVTRLTRSLVKNGIDSDIIALKVGNGIEARIISPSMYRKVYNHAKWIGEQKLLGTIYQKSDMFFDMSNYGVFTKKEILKLEQYDIIHLHYINGMISYNQMKRLLELRKIVVWTMHDCWAFTGGCHHYQFGCEGFKNECGSCPILHGRINDFSKKTIQAKIKAFSPLIKIISPSHWMKKQVNESKLFGHNICECIHNGLDLEIFKYKNFQPNKESYKILIGADAPKTSPYKGYDHIVRCMRELKNKRQDLYEKITLVFFGKGCTKEELEQDFDGYRIDYRGYISEQEKMAALYRECDYFLTASLYDNLPTTLIESIASGTPCIGYRTGGIEDIIKHKQNGYLAEREDVNELTDGVIWCIDNNKGNILGENGHNYAMQYFDDNVIAKEHIRFYQDCLRNNK